MSRADNFRESEKEREEAIIETRHLKCYDIFAFSPSPIYFPPLCLFLPPAFSLSLSLSSAASLFNGHVLYAVSMAD